MICIHTLEANKHDLEMCRAEERYADLDFPVWLKWFMDEEATNGEAKLDALACMDCLRHEFFYIAECIYLDESSSHKPGGNFEVLEELRSAVAKWLGVQEVRHG